MKKKIILFYGELPPTVYHGISISNQRILLALANDFTIYKVQDNTSFGRITRSLFSFFSSLIKLMYFSSKKVDIYYLNLPMSYLGLWKVYFSVLVVKLFSQSTKVVSHLHRGDFLNFIERPRNRKLFNKFSERVEIVIVLSNTAKTELISSGLINSVKVEVLHNTVIVMADKEQIIKTTSYDFSNSHFYCLCNYIPTKRIHHLVKIANEIPLSNMTFNGASSSDSYLHSLKELNKSLICRFDGVISGGDKDKKLQCAKALILPSLNEGMPLVLLESLAQGTPVICFDIGYISDYIGEDYPGLVTERTDMALKNKIIWLNQLSNEDYLALRKLSFNMFWERFDPEIINSATYVIFKKL